MLIIALVLALIGLVALVFAVVTSNELVAWVCIAASVVGVVLLILDAVRERQRRDLGDEADEAHADEAHADEAHASDEDDYVDYPEEVTTSDEPATATETEESKVAAEGRGDEAAK
ncbi:hypothetical protein [Mycobacterium sp. 94-17]|uniref:hypothetical protein n=1 Tax=Mycobacterium sp. 94-17 TaxID=2986147 RepID=UPI002D1F1EDB|nr:hypothetical protein [Mycobacterium sp. 94-17]MEB4210666.1 hypothetical protein [Mycobacterium sp. 94-17]